MNTHTHVITEQHCTAGYKSKGRLESLTFTYNLFMLHAVIRHTCEKVHFFHSGNAQLKKPLTLK